MSTEPKKRSAAEQMQLLERRANVIRSRLLRAVDALDARRHQVTEVGMHVKEAAPKIGLSILVAAALAAGSVLGLRSYLNNRRKRELSYRITHLLERHRASRRELRPAFFVEMLEKVALTGVTVLVHEVARRVTKNLVDGRFPDGRLAAGHA